MKANKETTQPEKETSPEWPKFIKAPKNPNVAVKLYPITQKNKQTKDGATIEQVLYRLEWTVNGKRMRRHHADEQEARKDAAGVAASLAGKTPELGELDLSVRTDISASIAALRKAGIDKPLAAVISDVIEAHKHLDGIGSIVEAAKDYAKRNAGLRQVLVPDAVKEWIDEETHNKAGRERSEAWVDKLKKNVQTRFAHDFTGYAGNLDSITLGKWFNGLKNLQKGPHEGDELSETTKRNIRDDLASFFRWCQSHKYLPKDADLLEAVPEFQRKSQRTKGIITPDELQRLFDAAPDYLIPYLAVRSLAGVRESEANLLDWKHVHLDTGWIEITEEVAKQTNDEKGVARDIPIQPALKAWLAGYALKEGPVCQLTDPLQAIPRLARRAKVALPKNALRHSYITYRAAILADVPRVADECGNSPEIIRKWYRKRGAQVQADAPKWFDIWPKPAGSKIIPHPAAAAR